MRRLLLSAGLVAVGAMASAQTVSPGCDCYVTDPPPVGDSTIEIPVLPAGFFGTVAGSPSDPFPLTIIQVQGLPLPTSVVAALCPNSAIFETVWVDQHGTPVAPNDIHRVTTSQVFTGFEPIDTIVCRTLPTLLPPVGGTVPVPIELTQLSLESVAPITVTYGGGAATRFWDVFVTESGVTPGGSITMTTVGALPTAVFGSMQMNNLPVQYQLTFEETTGTIGPQNLPGNLNFSNPSNGNWQFSFGTGGPVPLLGGAGLLLLAALLLVGGMYLIRKRASAAS